MTDNPTSWHDPASDRALVTSRVIDAPPEAQMGVLKRLFKRPPERRGRVTFDSDGVTRALPDGRVETVRWNDLQEVVILTTDHVPWADDVIWMLVGSHGQGCAVPSETDGMNELLPRLRQLPRFDNRAVIGAMGSTGNARFVCWRRDP